ncbi:hypothetical protein SAMN04488524_4673 [Pedobacter africanus]|uniref:Uncharacterized protein n=1 Tax=Pedobacter africanus TaxID=151894 RepID=A0A1W2EBE5_9SPHI|nr:hypothetical protein SAMN04488524_4673 [Pedobacter africanus]
MLYLKLKRKKVAKAVTTKSKKVRRTKDSYQEDRPAQPQQQD